MSEYMYSKEQEMMIRTDTGKTTDLVEVTMTTIKYLCSDGKHSKQICKMNSEIFGTAIFLG